MDKQELQKVELAIHDLINKDEYETAMPLINEVLEHYPNDSAALNFLGYIWLQSDKPAFAYQCFRRAVQESPGNKALWTSLGRATHEMDMYEEAIKYFLKSAELDPNYALAYSNAGASFVQMSEWKKAEDVCLLALDADPNDLHAQLNLCHAYLAQGKWEKGWKQWAKSLGGKYRKEWHYHDESRWQKQPDKNIVIYGEQGLGDEIFYGNCIPDAINISKKVYIDCDSKLEGLFARSFPDAEVHGTRREEYPEWIKDKSFDHRCAIGGLPEFFRLNSKTFPRQPYLKADPQRKLMWRSLFDSWGKKVIGLTTHGGNKRTNAKGRELTQEDLEPLLKQDYKFVSLDYNIEKKLDGVEYFPFATQSNDYDDTAALIDELDMVIGVNTTAQHCSSALGIKTICLVPKWHQWRYAQSSMPWYRHMRLVYQNDKTWKQVIEQLNI